ncbi:hypothetical protein ACOMHN_063957 [Nucella lapillus]
MDGPDLSSLPDVVLLHLFQMLPLPDRGRLASCCSSLSHLMTNPSVWRDVSLRLEVDVETITNDQQINKTSLVEGFGAGDRAVIWKYCEHFHNIRLLMSSVKIESRTLEVLAGLCRRNAIKTVVLRFDSLFSKLMELPSLIVQAVMSSVGTIFPLTTPSTVVAFINMLGEDVRITVELPHNNQRELFLVFIHLFLAVNFYRSYKSRKGCSLLRKLVLSRNVTPEKRFHRTDATPTATLVSSFPNLEDLHVNMVNLSDQLLQALSAPSRKQTPLRCLVIRHISDRYVAFPKVSSAVWACLAEVNPSLRVECCVVADTLPLLSEIVKPDTPLVKLKVDCKLYPVQNMLALYKLGIDLRGSLQHVDLSIGKDDTYMNHTKEMQLGLKNMVLECRELQHLTCSVHMHQRLVDLLRDSRQWGTFRFNPSRICAW